MARAAHQFAPCKINLHLAVTGARSDGFHDLVSLVAPLAFGDRLRIEEQPDLSPDTPPRLDLGGRFSAGLPADSGNLVLKAWAAFREAGGRLAHGLSIHLDKRVPAAAGLGGGSSDAAACLRGLNGLAERGLGEKDLASVAAGLGSDCPLFLSGRPVVMRGRGERLEPVRADWLSRWAGWRILVFAPHLEISTPWAYSRLRESTGAYAAAADAEAGLTEWLEATDLTVIQPFNSFEAVVGAKFLAIPVLLDEIRSRFGIPSALSGSGSACFACVAPGQPTGPLQEAIRSALGKEVFLVETALYQPFDHSLAR
ncbi:MAG: 4-(cytidine 5'-diphospho)-2-C-methyl-D-erythritol kinase [Opitutales bacterium]